MDNNITSLIKNLESIKHLNPPNGGEYWMARELMSALGYAKWENFEGVIFKS